MPVKRSSAMSVLRLIAGRTQPTTERRRSGTRALGTPVAAIIAFVDPGTAKDQNCAALIAEADSKGPRAPQSATPSANPPPQHSNPGTVWEVHCLRSATRRITAVSPSLQRIAAICR